VSLFEFVRITDSEILSPDWTNYYSSSHQCDHFQCVLNNTNLSTSRIKPSKPRTLPSHHARRRSPHPGWWSSSPHHAPTHHTYNIQAPVTICLELLVVRYGWLVTDSYPMLEAGSSCVPPPLYNWWQLNGLHVYNHLVISLVFRQIPFI